MLAKLCGLLFTLLTCAGVVMLVYVASIASHESQEDANKTLDQLFLQSVSGRLLSSARSALQQQLKSYKEASATVASMYKQEGIPGWNTNKVPGNVTATWLGTLGIHKAFTGQVVYLTLNYLIPESAQVGNYSNGYWNHTELWGVGGCENFGYDLCYFVDDASVIRLYNHTSMTPQYEFDSWSPYNQHGYFADVRTIATVYKNNTEKAGGFWLPSELFTDPVYYTTEQMAAYALPVFFDEITGKCTAAVKWEYNLTYFDEQLSNYLPTNNSKLIFYDSSVTNGTFLASSTRETPLFTNNSKLFTAIGGESPSADEEVIELVVRKLNSLSAGDGSSSSAAAAAMMTAPTQDLEMKVNGWFVTSTHYYEATTVENKFTIVLEAPLTDLTPNGANTLSDVAEYSGAAASSSSSSSAEWSFQSLKKEYSPKGFKLHDFMNVWPKKNLQVVIAVMAVTLLCALIHGVIGCVCGKGGDETRRKSSHDEFYREHGDELLGAPSTSTSDCPPGGSNATGV